MYIKAHWEWLWGIKQFPQGAGPAHCWFLMVSLELSLWIIGEGEILPRRLLVYRVLL